VFPDYYYEAVTAIVFLEDDKRITQLMAEFAQFVFVRVVGGGEAGA